MELILAGVLLVELLLQKIGLLLLALVEGGCKLIGYVGFSLGTIDKAAE